MSKNKSLVNKTVKGVFWNYSVFAGSKLVNFVVTIILARVLVPEDFGLVALALVVINFMEIVNQFGIGAAVIQRQDEDDRITHVAFWLNVVIGLALTTIAFLTAPLLSDFLREQRLVAVLQVLSLSFIASTMYAIPQALLSKELKFRRRMVPELIRTVIKGFISVGMALNGFGAWSLVGGHLGGMLFSGVVYWFVVDWRPRLIFNFGLARSILSYGGQLMLGEFTGVLNRNIDYLIIGRSLSVVQLGYYTLAFRLPELLIISLVGVVGRTVFPAYSKIQDDYDALRTGFLTLIRYTSLLTLPMGIGLLMIAPEFIPVAYTSRWEPAIPVMQVLAMYAVVLSLSYNTGAIYKAIGRPDILTKIAILKISITVPLLIYAVQFDILAVAWAQLASTSILTLVRLGIVKRILKLKVSDILGAFRPTLISAIIMLAGTTLISELFFTDLSMVTRLLLMILVAIPLYLGSLWIVGEALCRELLTYLKPVTSKLSSFRLRSTS
jgi:O-antigen/teichoic acid export membrane protein